MQTIERHAWIIMAAVGIVVGGLAGLNSIGTGVVITAVFLGVAYWMSPWRGGRSVKHAELDSLPDERLHVVVYWRPGCMYCSRLKRALGGRGRDVTWVNIWQDDDAAAFVRSVNNGNETVPTVVLAGEPHTNPAPGLVLQSLSEVD